MQNIIGPSLLGIGRSAIGRSPIRRAVEVEGSFDGRIVVADSIHVKESGGEADGVKFEGLVTNVTPYVTRLG